MCRRVFTREDKEKQGRKQKFIKAYKAVASEMDKMKRFINKTKLVETDLLRLLFVET